MLACWTFRADSNKPKTCGVQHCMARSLATV
jgi:hypothetical protein